MQISENFQTALSTAIGSGFNPSSLISTVLFIGAIIGRWRIFENCGEPGWQAMIPIYNKIVYGRLSDNIKAAVLYMIFGVISSISAVVMFIFIFIGVFSSFTGDTKAVLPIMVVSMTLTIIFTLGCFAAGFFMYSGLLDKTGHPGIFVILFLILPQIAEMVLGFTSKNWQYESAGTYQPKTPSPDTEQPYQPHLNTEGTGQPKSVRTAACPKCGGTMYPIDGGLMQCQNCRCKFRHRD